MNFQEALVQVDVTKPPVVHMNADNSLTLILKLQDGHELMIGSRCDVFRFDQPSVYSPVALSWCIDGSAAG